MPPRWRSRPATWRAPGRGRGRYGPRASQYNPVIESLDRERLLDLQWRKLTYQLSWLADRNPFYATRLREAGVLRLGIRPDQAVMTFLTSGTPGVGQAVYGHTWKDALLSGTKYLEGPLCWMGLRKGDRVFAMTPVATLAFGLMVMETFRLAGYQPFEVFNMPSPAKLQLMQRFPPHAIVITPVHLARLTMICAEEGIDPREAYAPLKGILIAGQACPAELAARCEEAWGKTKTATSMWSTAGRT